MKKISLALVFFLVGFSVAFLTLEVKAASFPYQYFVGNYIEDIAISGDGKTIVVGTPDGYVRCLDNFGSLKWTYQYQMGSSTNPIEGSVSISNDGNTIAACYYRSISSTQHQVKANAFELNGGILWSYDHYFHDQMWAYYHPSISVSWDGSLIVFTAGYYGEYVMLYNREGSQLWYDDLQYGLGKPLTRISNDGNLIISEVINKQSNYEPCSAIVALNRQGTILWCSASNPPSPETGWYSEFASSLSISDNGSLICVGCKDDRLYVYDQNGTQLWSYSTIDGNEVFVDVSGDSSTIVVGSFDQKVVLFDKNGTKLWEYSTPSFISSVSLSENGSTVAAGCADGNVYLFSKNGTLLWNAKTNNKAYVCLSADGQILAAGSDDQNVYIVPEFPSFLILSLFMIISLLYVITRKRFTDKP